MFPKKISLTRGTFVLKLMTFPVVSRDLKFATAVRVVNLQNGGSIATS